MNYFRIYAKIFAEFVHAQLLLATPVPEAVFKTFVLIIDNIF
jgi:hypothetical protein